MMRNPACPSLMNITEPDVEANKLFRLYVLYRKPQLQILDVEAVTERERKEASVRGQFAIKLKRVGVSSGPSNTPTPNNIVSPTAANPTSEAEEKKQFSSKINKRASPEEKPALKASEGNRFISNSQL